MTIEISTFFREVTLRICSSLDIKQALQETFEYIGQFMPADMIGLGFVHVEEGEVQTVAKCTSSANDNIWESLQDKISLNQSQKEYLMQNIAGDTISILANKNQELPKPLFSLFPQLHHSSAIFLGLDIRGEKVGTLLVSAEGENRYTADHFSLLSAVREPFSLAMINARRYRELERIKNHLEEDNRALQTDIKRSIGMEVVGADFGLREVMEQVHRIALSASPALLLGETGTGKEIIANAIHRASPRSKEPMISMQCGAIPETLLDSELFGHEKGAFTGATDRKRGRFERADGGTLFLDEVGELSQEAQVKLLRVLQEKKFERVGGTKTIEVDVRVIAATHRDLEQMVRQGTFREDLWYRLNVLPIRIPPLRLRRDDIPALIYYFVERKAREMNMHQAPGIRNRDIVRLQNYDWPGNVRELQNIVERALILSHGSVLVFPDLTTKVKDSTREENTAQQRIDTSLTLDEAMAIHIKAVLEEVYWQVAGNGGAAEILDVKPSTLRFRMKKLGIAKKKLRQRPDNDQ